MATHATSSIVLAALMSAAAVEAQCTTPWLAGLGSTGTNGPITDLVRWDPDGTGPLPVQLVLVGRFTFAGTLAVTNVATLDTTSGSWGTLGAGLPGEVNCVVVDANGDLVVGGETSVGGFPTGFVARWNGATWTSLGSGMSGTFPAVYALAASPQGDLIAGGSFTMAGGIACNRIARWTGTTWSPLGLGVDHWNVSAPTVHDVRILANGDALACGLFTSAGGIAAEHVARWNGTSWSALGTGLDAPATASVETPNGDLVVGGMFTAAGGVAAAGIARWNGNAWQPLGSGLAGTHYPRATTLGIASNGDLQCGGSFTSAGGTPAQNIARWNGSSWAPLGSAAMVVPTAVVEGPPGTLFLAGAAATGSLGILLQNSGTDWAPVGGGFSGPVAACCVTRQGELFVGGSFLWVGNQRMSNVARWTPAGPVAVGAGIDGPVTAMAAAPNGDLIVAGGFQAASGLPCSGIARWNGTTWSPLGTGLPVQSGSRMAAQAVAALPNGDVVVGGYFVVSSYQTRPALWRWDGASWAPLATFTNISWLQNLSFSVRALTVLPTGELVAGGSFTDIGGLTTTGLARWNGTQWLAFGAGVQGFSVSVDALAVTPGGELLVGGNFFGVDNVSAPVLAKWDGAAWSALAPGSVAPTNFYTSPVRAIAALPNGDCWVGGYFTSVNGTTASSIARLRGTSWQAAGAGVTGSVACLATLPDGDIAVGGHFFQVNGAASAFAARLTTTCPATSTIVGNGCAGSGGLNMLATTALPWLSATARSRAVGFAANSIGVAVFGLTPVSAPLAAALPMALPGCTLLTSADLTLAIASTAGSATTELVIPGAASLLAQSLLHQVVALELAPSGAISVATSTNALRWTIGSL